MMFDISVPGKKTKQNLKEAQKRSEGVREHGMSLKSMECSGSYMLTWTKGGESATYMGYLNYTVTYRWAAL